MCWHRQGRRDQTSVSCTHGCSLSSIHSQRGHRNALTGRNSDQEELLLHFQFHWSISKTWKLQLPAPLADDLADDSCWLFNISLYIISLITQIMACSHLVVLQHQKHTWHVVSQREINNGTTLPPSSYYIYQISHTVFPVDARCLYSTSCIFQLLLKPFSKSLLAQSYAPSSTSLPTVCRTRVWRSYICLCHEGRGAGWQEHTQLHFTSWSSSRLLGSSGFPCWSQLLKPGTTDAASRFLLASLKCNIGWRGIAATPLGMKDLTLIFTSTDFAAFWVPYMASEPAQRSGGSSLFTQTWERSTDLWAPSQLGHNTSMTLDKPIHPGRKKAHIKGSGTGSSESKDIQPSPQPSWKLPHLSPLPRIISFNHSNSQHCQRSTGEADLKQLCWNQFILPENRTLSSLKKLSRNEGCAIIPRYLKSLFQGLIKMT